MKNKKEISINLSIVENILGSVILSIIIVYSIQLFGSFRYLPGSSCIYFGSFTINDYSYCEYENYNLETSTKIVTYIRATFLSYKYLFLLTLFFTFLRYIIRNFKIKFN
jgi:hypothetical protein